MRRKSKIQRQVSGAVFDIKAIFNILNLLASL